MARWNDVITLCGAKNKWQDSVGAWHEGERENRLVFCNEYTIGLVAMAHLRNSDIRAANSTEPVDVGLRNEHMVQVRAIDYENEDEVIFHGEEYEVIYVSGSGETRYLTIGQKLGSSGVDDD